MGVVIGSIIYVTFISLVLSLILINGIDEQRRKHDRRS